MTLDTFRSPRPRGTSTAVALAVAITLALALRVVFFTGYHGYDDALYIARAFALSEGDRSLPAGAWEARLGLVGPTALLYRAFGVSPITTNLYPFACSLASVVVALVLGSRLLVREAARLAALMLALLPLDVLFAGQLFPTAPVILLGGSSLGLFALAERTQRARTYLASGVCLGLALVVHEGVAMAVACYPACVVLCGRPRRDHGWLLVGAACGLALDPLLNTALFGEPLARLVGLRASHATMLGSVAADVAYAGFNRAWIGEGLLRPFVERTFGLFPWVLVPAWWMALRSPRVAPQRALAVMIAAAAIWILFGSISLTHYSPMSRMPRYLAPVVLPAMWLLGWFLTERGVRARRALVATLGITSVGCLALDSGSALPPYDQARDLLARRQVTHVLAEHPFPLRFAEGMRPRYRLDVLSPAGAPPSGAFVVVRHRRSGDRIARLPGARRVAVVSAPTTLYRRALGSTLVMRILRATRPPDRFAEYADKVDPVMLAIYRIQ